MEEMYKIFPVSNRDLQYTYFGMNKIYMIILLVFMQKVQIHICLKKLLMTFSPKSFQTQIRSEHMAELVSN